ncbi:flavin reductase family protein [Rhodococcus qingshengii]|uniref:flavin reductase family protein n=1 Tax=Rhodococcus qingshengii TaxID=334542 RepID=UPI00237CD8C6|nr:flavin reductase family protein [Rhodococcus qingshengii]WCT06029.1 flavin reductase family protein [Rhodococcus qingshengii]
MVTTNTFRDGMRRLAAGVSIISTQSPQGPQGITATAVTSLSADPPSVIACVNRSLQLSQAIRTAGSFGINILRDRHSDVARTFAGMNGLRGTEKFSVGAWNRSSAGTPLLTDALAGFDCDLDQIVESGTHYILIGRVTEIVIGDVGEPLVYCAGEFTGLRPLSAAS